VRDVRKPPYTDLRGNQWQYRRRVPDAPVPILEFAEYRESLQTSSMEEARIRAAIRNAEVTVELQAVKRQQQSRSKPEAAAGRLSP